MERFIEITVARREGYNAPLDSRSVRISLGGEDSEHPVMSEGAQRGFFGEVVAAVEALRDDTELDILHAALREDNDAAARSQQREHAVPA